MLTSAYWGKVNAELDRMEQWYQFQFMMTAEAFWSYLVTYLTMTGAPDAGFEFPWYLRHSLESGLVDYMQRCYELGRMHVRQEAKSVEFAGLPQKRPKGSIRSVASEAAGNIVSGLEKVARKVGADATATTMSYKTEWDNATSTFAVTTARYQGMLAYNEGRLSTGGEKFYVSALLDGRTCNFCRWMHGKWIDVHGRDFLPPFHYNCRCVVMPAVVWEAINPPLPIEEEIAAIPKLRLRKRGLIVIRDSLQRKGYVKEINYGAAPDVVFARSINRAVDDVYRHTDLYPLDKLTIKSDWMNGSYSPVVNEVVIGGDARYIVDLPLLKSKLAHFKEKLKQYAPDSHLHEVLQKNITHFSKIVESMESGRYDYYVDHSNYAMKDTVEAVTRHELGHLFHAQHIKDVRDELGLELTDIPDAVAVADYSVTARAKDNPAECFAENFALYSKGKIERLHPKMLEFFRKHTTWGY